MHKELPPSPEREPRRKARILMVRHGEPEQYAVKDAHLSERGKQQIREFARSFVDGLRSDPNGNGAVVKVLYSEVARTKDSATEFLSEIKRIVSEEQLEGINILESRKRSPLKSTGTLGPLIEKGVPKPQLYDAWLEADESKLEEIGARTPGEIARVIGEFAEHLQELSDRAGVEGPEINYVCFTHETTHGAMLKTVRALDIPKINFAEPIEMDVQTDGEIKVIFRDKEYDLPIE